MKNKITFLAASLVRNGLVCLVCLFFVTCKKDVIGKVTGKVTNLFDGTPIEGINVQIYYSNQSLFNYKTGDLPMLTTNANGEFSMDVTFESEYEYRLAIVEDNIQFFADTSEIYKRHYYSYYKYKGIDIRQGNENLSKTESPQHIELKVAPLSRLKIATKNVPPTDPSDRIKVDIIDENVDGGSIALFEAGYVEITSGGVSDVGPYKMVPAKSKTPIKWVVTSNSQQTTYYDTIAILPYKKFIYYINY